MRGMWSIWMRMCNLLERMHIYYYSAFTNCSFLATRNRKMNKKRILLSGNTRSTLMAKSEEELKNFLIKVKEESERTGLKLNIQKTKVMASNPMTSWQIGGEIVETVRDFILLGSKITADGDCSHEIKRHLLLGRKTITNLDSIFKSRDITLPTRVHLVQSYGFASSNVWMWELDH